MGALFGTSRDDDTRTDPTTGEPPWLVPYHDIAVSFQHAMRAAGVDADVIDHVSATVEDYAINHYGDD